MNDRADLHIPLENKLRARLLVYQTLFANRHILAALFLRNYWKGFLRLFRP
jgi:hypothetical protein